MSKAAGIAVWTFVALLGAYIPVWWGLVFGGYYDGRMSSDLIGNAKTFLAADIVLAALFVGFIVGLRGRRLWGYVCGFMVCGAGVYVCVHGAVAIVTGTLPGDPATQLIFWPYLIGSILGAVLLYRRLAREGMRAPSGKAGDGA